MLGNENDHGANVCFAGQVAHLTSELYEMAIRQATYDDLGEFTRFGQLLTQLEALYATRQTELLPARAIPAPAIIHSAPSADAEAAN